MKSAPFRFLCLLLLTGFTHSLQALQAQQANISGFQTVAPQSIQATAGGMDTLDQYFQRATAYLLLSADTAGYVLGTGSVAEQTGCHFDGNGTTTVHEALVFIGRADAVGAPDSLSFHLFECGPDSMPIRQQAGGVISVADIAPPGYATVVSMRGIPTVNAHFILSMEHPIDDTVALLSSNPLPTNGGPDGMAERRTRQKTANGWKRSWDLWTVNGGPYDADAMIIPVVTFTPTGAEDAVHQGNLSLLPPFPQPGLQVNLPFACKHAGQSTLQVMDLQGKVLLKRQMAAGAGRNSFLIGAGELPAGTYIYMISAGRDHLAGKFTLQN